MNVRAFDLAAVLGLEACEPAAAGASGDFDFLHGAWVVENRRLADPLEPSGDWATFDTIHTCTPLLDGRANLVEVETDDSHPYAMLHLFEPAARTWAVHVLSADGTMSSPLRGGMRAGHGVFTGRWRVAGEHVLVRHVWDATRRTPEWSQSYSADGGATWAINWTMRFSRVHWPA